MKIEDMHFDFRKKLNKMNTNGTKTLLIPEIDLLLNEAQLKFVNAIALSREPSTTFFENKQRTIDDIRTLVVENKKINLHPDYKDTYMIPHDYLSLVRGFAETTNKSGCKSTARLYVVKHDQNEEDFFYCSSFRWKMLQVLFNSCGIKMLKKDDFDVDNIYLSYIKKPVLVSNALSTPKKEYKLPSGVYIRHNQDCELPEQVHSEIVDFAVMLCLSEINQNLQNSKFKNNLNINK